MGSLDAQFMHSHSYNPLLFSKSQDFQQADYQNVGEREQVKSAASYNPFAAAATATNPATTSSRPYDHTDTRYDPTTRSYDQATTATTPRYEPPPTSRYEPARYDPLSQTLPPFPTGYDRPVTASFTGFNNGYEAAKEEYHGYGPYDGFERPATVHGYGDYPGLEQTVRGYNPFSQEYEPSPPEHGDGSLVSYNYLPIRVQTPPNMRQYAHPPLYPAHYQEPPEPFPASANDAVVPFDPSGKSQRLLWLSEEEAEIIRLIRLSQMKENLRSSGFSLSEEQLSPDVSPQPAADLRGSSQKNEKGTSSKSSTTSADELSLPVAAEQVRPKAAAKKEAPSQKRPELKLDAAGKLDTAKIVDDDREWIAAQRQKIKAIQARKRQNAAVCIQRRWREYRKHLKSRKTVSKKRGSIRQQPANVQNVRRDKRFSVQEAAKVIQRAWRAASRRRRLKKLKSREKLPKTLKGLYETVKFRHSSNGLNPPSYARFLKLLDRIHACTEGARIRRRLKTRRLQAIVKEIKEIRALMEDMSADTAPTSAELLAQLSGQLQRKIIQLHTALQGPGEAARYLLRRGPATPLVIYGSRSTSPTSQLQRSGEQVQIRVIGNPHTENGVPSVRCSLFTVNSSSGASTEAVSEIKTGSRKVRLQKPEAEAPRTLNHDDKPLKRQQEFKPREAADSRSVKPGSEAQRSGKTSQYFFIEKDADTVQLPASRSENAVASRLSQYLVGSSSRYSKEPEDYGYESTRKTLESLASDSEQQSDQERPKRPFLRRKSIAMAPQKLDWSKVKPMVSSRLEPELKTKLYRSKVKEIARNASSKKTNYSNVKSRLFSYESQAVDASGALSSDRSISIETEFENPGQKGYAEIHTQVDMKEDCWRPASAGSAPQDEPLPNYRYGDEDIPGQALATEEGEEAEDEEEYEEDEEESPPAPKPPPKASSRRFQRSRSSYAAARSEPGSSALEEIDHNGELERKKQSQHSFRYKEAAAAAPEASLSVKEPATSTKRDRNGGKKESELQASGKKDEDHRVIEASPELEATFKHVMSIKNDGNVSVLNLFGAPQQAKSIVPRLFTNASIFNSSFTEKRRLHELLIQEGRASKLQHDSLAFVSIRD